MNERLKYGGRALWTTLGQLFNAMLNKGHIPSGMQKGVNNYTDIEHPEKYIIYLHIR